MSLTRPMALPDEMPKGMSQRKSAASNWIEDALKEHVPGALHKSLGVPLGQKIPTGKLKKAAAGADPLIAKRARLAMALKGFH